jgi:uncharacterized protein
MKALMKRFLPYFLALATVASASVSYAQENIVTIGTGSVTGVYYPAGGAICRLINRGRKEHGFHCYAESTGGSVYNIRALRDGEITFGIAQSNWQYDAYNGKDIFVDRSPFSNMRSVLSLHSEMFTVAVGKDSGISKFSDLKGKRVNIGDAESGMRDVMQNIMEKRHWTKRSFAEATEYKPIDAARELCAGNIDAMVFTAGHPNGIIQDIAVRCGARLISVEGSDIDKLLTENPYYARTAIPGGMYQGNPQNTTTFGVKATLLTTAEVDDEAVYQLTKAVFDNFENFRTLHFVFATLEKDRMVSSGLIAPIHPGAMRYYKEVGLIKDDVKPVEPTSAKPKSDGVAQ